MKIATITKMDHFKVYVPGKNKEERMANVKALASKRFPRFSSPDGNVSALYNDALHAKYKLDPDTWKEVKDQIDMVAEPKAKPFGGNAVGPKRKK